VKNKNVLTRQLGLFDSAMMMMGIVIGSGIFLTTGIMAQAIPSAFLILLAWLVGGLLILAGALTYAELGVSLPEAGGQYVYLREAYLVNMTGSIAALGVGFAEYFGKFFPFLSTKEAIFSTQIRFFKNSYSYSLSRGQIVAVVVIVLLSAINYLGVGFGKTVQNVLTVIKIGTILALSWPLSFLVLFLSREHL
jgi:APA family basic amino acid/polyamine antiporter